VLERKGGRKEKRKERKGDRKGNKKKGKGVRMRRRSEGGMYGTWR
jgi:hypothetical protein